MKHANSFVCHAIALVMSIVWLGGCQSSQQPGRPLGKRELLNTIKAQQAEIDELKHNLKATTALLPPGKRKLLNTIKAQQAEIDELKRNVEATTALLFEVMEQLAEFKGLPQKAEAEKKQNPNIGKRRERKRVPRTRTSAKPRPTTSKTKRTGGCPCKQRRTK